MTHKKLLKNIKNTILITCLSTSVAFASETIKNIHTISQQDIVNSGLNNLGDIINETVMANGTVLNQFNNNGGNGSTWVNLNALGSNNILVLLNGKRLSTNIQGNFDFSGIPLSFIQRVEIGQSNDVGAISAVINIVTNSKFTGVETSAYYGMSSRGDAETQNYNISIGKNTDKASIFFNAEWSKNSPIYAGDRDISALPIYATGNNFGSNATPQGRFVLFDQISDIIDVTTTPGSDGFNLVNDPDLVPFTDAMRYNFAPANFLLTPQERKSIYLNGSYKISNQLSISSELLFTRRESQQRLAPTPLFVGLLGAPTSTGEYIGIGGSNPYNPYGYDLLPDSYASRGLLLIARRLLEAGDRTTNNSVDTYNFNIGLSGSMTASSNWEWAISYNRSNNDRVDSLENFISLDAVAYALSNECVNDNACVPLNLFGGAGSITPEMVAFIEDSARNQYSNSTDTFQARTSSVLTNLSAGELKVSTGYEYRKNSGYIKPSGYQYRPNYTAFSTQFNQTIDASYSTNELFADFEIPLIANKLAINLMGKYSKYDSLKGEFSGNLGAIFTPVNSIRVTLDYSQQINPPSLYQLYSDELLAYVGIEDVCIGNGELSGCNNDLFQYDGLFPSYFEGNSRLNLEKFKLATLNINYQPESIENLQFNLSANRQTSDNLISAYSAQNLMEACAYTGESQYCDRVIRNNSGYLAEVRPTYYNDGKLEQTRFTFDTNYQFSVGSANFGINLQNMFVQKYRLFSRNFKENTFNEFDFISLKNIQREIPQLRSNLSFNMEINNFSMNYQLRYISGYEETCNPGLNSLTVATNDPNAVGGVVATDFQWCTYGSPNLGDIVVTPGSPVPYDRRHVGGSSFQDINFKFTFAEFKADIIIGVENIFDKTPPLSSSVVINSYDTGLYNGTGRYYWLRFNKQF